MKFDDLDKRMRIYETNSDICVLPQIYMVARIDGRNFTTLTKQKHNFETPFDIRFRDYMVETVKHLMNVGFNVVYGYTESDEISLLFNQNETAFNRKTRKYNSILAGEASAKFSLLLNDLAAFDCRISQLPTKEDVVDYFRWRNEDAFRNALNAHCYWILRKDGFTAKKATQRLETVSVADKNELLFSYGINFNDLPSWQKRGIGIYWKEYQKRGVNPITKEIKITERKQLFVDMDLEMKDAYSNFIKEFLV
ncbi:tRNA(His) guanylyltransferase Thg1 family protein [Bernardetia sp. OM2101]|uniref:tRNA(His) guanylyltransferase Thg1 family protein n=1 Tax=Bernardetia sp. OM2101 TaxID=3344876 RepID=UPI0035CF92A9